MDIPSVLIVDDNAVNVKLFRVLLEKNGFHVRTARDATRTMEALEESLPHLILMDVQLPDIDGLELTRRLKADPHYRQISIVALTAYAMKGDRERALDAGCQGYIPKPINTRTFADAIRQFCNPVPSTAARASKDRKLILIADDDSAQRNSLDLHLTEQGFEVITARDGAEAIEVMHGRRPDLVASDILMPRLDGYRLTQFLRHQPAFSSVPVVLMTSGTIRPDDEELARNLGANALAVRTRTFNHILDAIREALAQGVTGRKGDGNEGGEGIDELRARFVAESLGDLHVLLENAAIGFHTETVRQLAHRWTGTGSAVGLSQVSRTAVELEALLNSEIVENLAVREKIACLNDLFAAAQAQSGNLPDTAGASLSGKRFFAIGFDEKQTEQLTEALEHAHAVLRVTHTLPDTGEHLGDLFDGVMLDLTHHTRAGVLPEFIRRLELPLIVVGGTGAVVEAALNAHNGEHDFLLQPWNPSDLVLRWYALLNR